MSKIVRALGYTASTQRFVVNDYVQSPITVHLWGGGGGGGPGDGYGRGGSGGGGGYSLAYIPVSTGDVIDVAVGGAGQYGNYSTVGPGGVGGSSYESSQIFNSRTSPSPVTVYPIAIPYAWCGFLNQTGIWNTPSGDGGILDITYTVNFPVSGNYVFTASGDNAVYIYLDGSVILSMPGEYTYRGTYTTTLSVSAGNHSVRAYVVNFGGPGGLGLTIVRSSGSSFSGAQGGSGGSAGGSGGGGGSGGATVVLKNGVPVAVAGGGGGGGGAGQFSYIPQCDAPGLGFQAPAGIYNGQNGQSFGGDGGGAGAGGGGYTAGQGGATRGGETTGYGGANGGNYTISGTVQSPSGRTPGGTSDPYYVNGIAAGGSYGAYNGIAVSSGTAGYAVVEMDLTGMYVKNAGTWEGVSKIWIKANGVWREVKSLFVKNNGQWEQIAGQQTNAPAFTAVGLFGYNPRSY